MKLVAAFFVGALTGVVSSWGVGGGTLLVIYMSAAAKMPQQLAQGINLLYFLPTSAAALVSHLKNKLIAWRAVFPAILAGVPAAVCMSLLALRLDMNLLRKIFAAFVIAVGVLEFLAKDKNSPPHKTP
jgi:uncharacterized membrane protein YfcA